MSVQEHINLLGLPVKDKVTKLEGVVTSMSFDLYGCVQALVTPTAKDGKVEQARWMDVARLTTKKKTPVMACPDFNTPGTVAEGKKGPADKPVPGGA